MNNKNIMFVADICLCIVTGFVFYKIASWHIEFALFNGEYTPAFPDSFYHARRIMDSVQNGGLIQFDPNFHAPEGAWVTWPWGYDWFIARLIQSISFLSGITPSKVMVHIPPIWGGINIALLVSLGRVLGLLFPYRIIIALCFILLPLNQQLHLIGRIDNHYMEMTMVLLSSIFVIKWFQETSNNNYPIILGIVLGGAISIHTSLFVLQAPIIISLLIYWLFGNSLPKNTLHFSTALFLSTLIFLLPSEPFREGFFSFYYYSSFHLYISFCVSLLAYSLSIMKRSKESIFIVFIVSICMALPLIKIFLSGYGFISGDWNFLNTMGEVRSFLTLQSEQRIGILEAISNYSAFIFLLPVSLIATLYLTYKKPILVHIFFLVFSIMALFFLLKQMRFHYFGSILLYVPIALMFQKSFSNVNYKNKRILVFTLITLLAYWLPIGMLFKKQSSSLDFEATYWASKELIKHCNSDPGIVLAPASVGHYLTYFTNCSVLANSFIMAPQDFKYLEKIQRLLDLSSQELYEKEKNIKYIFLMREDNLNLDLSTKEIESLNSSLSKDILFSKPLSDNYKLLFEIKYKLSNKEVTFAKLVKIIR